MPTKLKRMNIAKQTLAICEQGFYYNVKGEKVVIQPLLDYARTHTFHYRSITFDRVFSQRNAILEARTVKGPPVYEVTNETTFAATRRLVEQEHRHDVACLNFASAKNPGGGFETGVQAQEESLARASGLYACINPMQEMYEINRHMKSCLYSDDILFSHLVPVFRDDADVLLDAPYTVSIITAPAVNAGVVRQRGGPDVDKIEATMKGRVEKILSLAVIYSQQTLVLGAWGCGVFKNSPSEVANYFKYFLQEAGTFRGAFQKVIFAIYDRSPKQTTLHAFKNILDGI
jgi:uncharacterized protein (TIGR02452 family)